MFALHEVWKEKNIWLPFRGVCSAHNDPQFDAATRCARDSITHRQQHALDLADCAEAAEEGQQTHKPWGDDLNVDGSREEIRTEQLAHEVALDERVQAQHKDNCASDLCARRMLQKELEPVFSISRVQRNSDSRVLLTKMSKLLMNMPYLTTWLQQSIRPPTPMMSAKIEPTRLWLLFEKCLRSLLFDARCGFSCVVQVLIIFTMATEPPSSLLARDRNESGMPIVRLLKVEAFNTSRQCWRKLKSIKSQCLGRCPEGTRPDYVSLTNTDALQLDHRGSSNLEFDVRANWLGNWLDEHFSVMHESQIDFHRNRKRFVHCNAQRWLIRKDRERNLWTGVTLQNANQIRKHPEPTWNVKLLTFFN